MANERNGNNSHRPGGNNGNGNGKTLGRNHVHAAQRTPAAFSDEPNDADSQPIARTPFSPQELDEFRRLLLAKRAQLVGDVAHMEAEALGRNRQDAAGDLSKVPMHMADVGSDAFEQEFTLGLIQSEQEVLSEIEQAIARIDAGTYGVCEATRRPISRQRLHVTPWARFCISHARQVEQRQPRRK